MHDGPPPRPFESAIELALQPGHFIAWNQESAFVADLEEAERRVSALTNSDPLRATRLYEAFIAACYLSRRSFGLELNWARHGPARSGEGTMFETAD